MNLKETAYWLDSIFPCSLNFAQVAGFHMASAELGAGESLACSVDFGEVDTGLSLTDAPDVPVRCEIFMVARAEPKVVSALVSAALTMLVDTNSQSTVFHAQPGTILPGMGAYGASDVMQSVSVNHGLLIAPFVWEQGVPQVREEERLTTLCQLIPLTDDEFIHAHTYGVAALQEALIEENVDLMNLQR
ncbi:suppressor of fused domain protein [Corynebacterium freiburgense]|uniref:suppressor of fused domain protein n=1 Tax=Corynebacterium freiburgense TaxID=556548 RepID=UPI00047B1F81|nr:suppressor of fused domain protein [Corynebacterium freiburgense]WJZ01422.1 Suppressor of fused protein (SUFU) [Corynebacterium freiburgense]